MDAVHADFPLVSILYVDLLTCSQVDLQAINYCVDTLHARLQYWVVGKAIVPY